MVSKSIMCVINDKCYFFCSVSNSPHDFTQMVMFSEIMHSAPLVARLQSDKLSLDVSQNCCQSLYIISIGTYNTIGHTEPRWAKLYFIDFE